MEEMEGGKRREAKGKARQGSSETKGCNEGNVERGEMGCWH